MAYSNADLKRILDKIDKPILMGFWPGKKGSDVFVLNPAHYGLYTPPDGHSDIDSSEDVTVYQIGGVFDRVEYIPGPHADDHTKITSKDMVLYDYINNVGLRHKVSQERTEQ